MSLEPEWFSTIYGSMLLIGQVLAALAFLTIVAARLSETEPMAEVATDEGFNDLGNLLLAFTMLWAYMSFSQYLITYSGNTSEEVIWYIQRNQGGWGIVSLSLIFIHFALPFLVLVRGSVFIFEHGKTPVWVAVMTAALLTGAVITAYAVWLARKFTKARIIPVAKWVALPLVVFYCSYSLLYLASVNAKAPPVKAYYYSVHPLLRLALSTLILVDRDMLITDTGRQPEDYAKMGLPENSRTRHYKQSDGWIHAVDLRTTGRGVIKNRGAQFYFWLMGFDTRRHVGTADHLHVELN